MNNVIEINQLRKNFETFQLKDISFSVPQGYITGFIGPNGSGKTTTIKSILSYISSDSGEIDVFGELIGENNEYLQDIGVVTDTPIFVKDWTVSQVEKVHELFFDNWNASLFAEHLKKFGISQSLKVSELSKGMSVKLMIAIALSHEAKLLVLDEPTSGLDPVAREEVCELLQDFVTQENHSVFFSTHITSDLESIADFIVFILHGDIVYEGTKDELIESYRVVKGGLDDLVKIEELRIIGLKKHQTGFEVLMRVEDAEVLEKELLVESVTLDQIILFFNRGGNKHE